MEKYKTIIQIEQIKKYLESGNCKESLSIAESIDKRKLKCLSDISIVAESYFQNQQYEQAKELFLRIYNINPSRRILAQLVHLSVKLRDVNEATLWLERFIKVAPDDFYQYIFQYSIDKIKKEPLEVLINDLEKLKKEEYIESWAYELAKLYHKFGDSQKCIDECNDIILWFGNGDYVDRAKALKAYYMGELDVSSIATMNHESKIQEESVNTEEETSITEEETSITEEETSITEEETPTTEEETSITEEKKSEFELPETIYSEQETETQNQNMPSIEPGLEVNTEIIETLKPHQKRIQLKPLTNSQLIGEEGTELEQLLDANQVCLANIFGNFMRMESVRKQLVRSLEQLLAQYKNSISLIVTGETESGKTLLAKNYAKLLYHMKLIQSSKIALIDGEKINKISLTDNKMQLKDCVLIIEHAGKMHKDTIKVLLDLNATFHNNIAIILIDHREYINKLLRSNNTMNSVFNNRIHLHKYSLEDYMAFAYDYISQKDYEIEMDAFITLQNEFSTLIKTKRENALQSVFSLIDTIIQSSEKRSTEQLLQLSKEGRIAESDLMVLKKEDIKF